MPDLAVTLTAAWATLIAGPSDRTAAARHIVLATTGAEGPEARLLVLRGADRAAGTLTLHTDTATAKARELSADPRAALLVWDPEARLQIRLRARMALRPGTPEEWAAVRDPTVYGGAPTPGTPIAEPMTRTATPDPARFTVLTATIHEIETLRLGQPHERARFTRAEGFAGRWLAP
jgi:pyridoxamine 5'-phosphate oxidase